MNFTNTIRQYWAALRALLVFTVIFGFGYPLLIWLVALIPGLHDQAEGSILTANGKPIGSKLIGQSFTDSSGNPLPQYFQSRPSAAGSNGYDPTASGGSSLGPEKRHRHPSRSGQTGRRLQSCSTPDSKRACSPRCVRAVPQSRPLEGVDGSRPFCTGGGVGAVLAVLGPRDSRGYVVHPTGVVSVNEPCTTTKQPFLSFYEGVRVECAKFGDDYSSGQIVPIRGAAPNEPQVPADAVTASGSGLDPDISPAYADIQVARVAKARHVSPDQIRAVLAQYRSGRDLGFFGEPTVNVLQVNLQLDHRYPVNG